MTEYFMYKRKERKERNELKVKEIYAGKNKATHSFSKLCRAAGRSDRERELTGKGTNSAGVRAEFDTI